MAEGVAVVEVDGVEGGAGADEFSNDGLIEDLSVPV